jgi:hypothetical protein
VALSFVLPLVKSFPSMGCCKSQNDPERKIHIKNKNQFQEAQKRAPITQKLISELQLLGNWKSSTQAILK